MRRVVKAVGVLFAAIACAIIFGVGVPLFWVWLGAQFQTTSGPNSGVGMLTVAIVLLGPLATYIALVVFAARFRFSQPADARREPQRMAWNRSRDEIRQKNRSTTTFEEIVLTAIFIVGFGFEVWFFFLAKCSSTVCFG
jgi:formate hydrogenlyase subunit 3/multisubunit Na+/H+ antiporter MnhD subunit